MTSMLASRNAPLAIRGFRMQSSPRCSEGVSLGTGLLSPEERDVLQLAATGLLSDEVAVRLGMSPDEVRGHSARAVAALGAGSRLEAVVLALRLGLIDLRHG